MAELLLDSLEIKGYRCFEHLTIEKLGRVNLIVGKNNVGKTALLEALWILINKGKVIHDILKSRDEDQNDGVIRVSQLANRSSEVSDFLIGNQDSIYYYQRTPNKNLPFRDGEPNSDSSEYSLGKGILIETNGMTVSSIKECWENIELTTVEDNVNDSMKLILPSLIRIRLRDFKNGNGSIITKIPFVQIKDFDKPLPLRSFGDGLNRLFGILLALVNCKGGILLIDEIENGFHYSILHDVWKLIFKTAKDLNVQVFATTHSKDCIEAFTQAAIDDDESEGMLIRLERNKDDKIIAKTIEEERLADAINYGAEVR